ncbi:MAG TPA: Stp1/IreP family PP2C-type Ser/Thr phosphatase [Cyanobacteria bacterium UBA11149]|nr:Stp1/IreP family PP2C-type Ser/Thr phosphatase [Cyanobacteria bacterium UBA11367]HBE56212.1 Stp1/IreP family PP2C-type Ser/Thr phosphatase [Cyanobacteria bacterium UBA11366]HBK66008.1 Stp1/IreP family PP2C-type Ser/Thr phosphatase [Cyanobacteria bacterium UBA11166]HBR74720.1 Stp1/IreP family PP2C-type Ser/Thr phosphatase [Cyanobacteria bacterium UBA11159]HBS70320.1 Stp1/IreP family PP2C-type Ser/Thr phosphatase [Cyanobacteria bacterium UBA11153]HBW90900.1 Stp1/IreP family PP2C-type Ser/Thr 
MKFSFTGLTDPGLVRTVNQDYYYTDPSGRFFIVADGMGGHAGGQEASQLATEAIKTHLQENWESETASDELMEQAFEQGNEAILLDQHKHPERADMGTTTVVVMFRQSQLWFAHIGDSRLYRSRDSKLEQITDDHTWVARAMKAGDLTPEQARSHPWRHVLSQCLGRKDLQKVEIETTDVQVGDRLLLCTDGLTEEVSDTTIAYYLQSDLAYKEVAQKLIESAKDNGGKDNITVVIVGVE